MEATSPRDYGPRDDLLFSDIAPYLAALAAGFFVGSVASLVWAESSYKEEGLGFLAILVGGITFGVAYRSILTLVGVLAALWCWAAVQTSMAPFASSECTFGLCSATMPNIASILGLGVAAIAYLISLLFRLRLRPNVGRRPGLVLGLISVVALASSCGVLVTTPSESSFTIDTPAGWAPYSLDGYWSAPEYGTAYRASLSGIAPSWKSYGPLVPLAPMIGVSVVRRNLVPDYGDPKDDCLRALYGWGTSPSWLYGSQAATKTISPTLSGATKEIVKTPAGDRIYGLGISRTRLVGLVPETLCYLVVISLPADSGLTEAQVDDIFATFRFR